MFFVLGDLASSWLKFVNNPGQVLLQRTALSKIFVVLLSHLGRFLSLSQRQFHRVAAELLAVRPPGKQRPKGAKFDIVGKKEGQKMEKEKLERICLNCNYFFPASMDGLTEFGICLNDNAFEPFLDELLDNYNYACCQNLIDKKKFTGDHVACPDFEEIDMEGCIEIGENSEFRRELKSSIESGKFNSEKLEELLIKERIRNIDFKALPVDKYSKQLKNPKPEERDDAISSLGALIAFGNEAAFQELFEFLQKLSPPKTIEEVHFKKGILRILGYSEFSKTLTPYLLDELYNTPSNNTTRQWIADILQLLKYAPREEIGEPLKKMLDDNRFPYRLKQKIENILYG